MQELTVFFIDIAGYTNRTATSSIDELMSMLEDFEQIIKPIEKPHDGILTQENRRLFHVHIPKPYECYFV